MKFKRMLITVIIIFSLFVVGIATGLYILEPTSVPDGNITATASGSGTDQSATDSLSSTATDTSSSKETASGTDSELTPSNDQTTDSDSDGLSDDREAELGTDPEIADSDGDGLNDGSELNEYGTNPTSADSDSDGLSDGREVELGTNPGLIDSDGDGLEDSAELNEYGTVPTSADSDSDGLNDGSEVTKYETNPTNPDTDGDGLKDGEEINRWKSDPLLSHSDSDGISDADEALIHSTDPTDEDTDGDGLSDDIEINGSTFPLSPDSDGDGLSDLEFKKYGTNATNPDTDGDGLTDGAELNSEALSESSPLRMDVFVEVDYMQSYKPREEAMNLVAEAYEEAPIDNPDGSTGISLHIVLDESIETEPTTEQEQKNAIANKHFDYEGYGYHYAIAVREARSDGDDVGGFAGGDSFVFQTSVNGEERYSHERTANIFMHELGHSVGLDPDLYKGIDSKEVPFSEYESVMNYNAPVGAFQYSNGEPFDDWEYIVRNQDATESVAGIRLSNQSVAQNGTQIVNIDRVVTSEGGFVTIRAGYAGGDEIGTSEYLVAGTHYDVRIELDDNIDDEMTLAAITHLDTNNNREYDFNSSVVDAPYTNDSGVVVDTATVSVDTDISTD
ncbi:MULTISPECIES: DUF7282 domain-containing protein [Salinibaculum]|uniref:DUF7282 domain-containing protein n=1 Tax=Salinibaculum TaxID=2732368 RepID=UPI0030CEF51D